MQLECRLKNTQDIVNKDGKITGTIVIAEVVLMHIAEGVAGADLSRGGGSN